MAIAAGATADVFNVTDPAFGANGNDSNDDAPAFRLAYAAAVTQGGGTIYIPEGRYFFDSADPLDSNSHLVIRHSGIRFSGDARAGDRHVDFGAIIHARSTKSVFTLAQAPEDPDGSPVIPTSRPLGVSFEHLQITRDALSREVLLVAKPAGILFSNLYPITHGKKLSIEETIVNDVCIQKHCDGIRTERIDAELFARALLVRMNQCDVRRNARHSMFLNEWGGAHIDHCRFFDNGVVGTGPLGEGPYQYFEGNGIRLLTHTRYYGTAAIIGCDIVNNGEAGIYIEGDINQTMPAPAQDISIVACQSDANGSQGIVLNHVLNLEITGCEFSANGGNPNLAYGKEGLYATDVQAGAFSGNTFAGNQGPGAAFVGCRGISMSGCTFEWNNNHSTKAVWYALMVSGGELLSFSALTFSGGGLDSNGFNAGPQDYGFLLQFSPRSVVASALSFPPGMNAYVAEFMNGPEAEFVVDYFNGSSLVRAEDSP
jgi:hypothetical protein